MVEGESLSLAVGGAGDDPGRQPKTTLTEILRSAAPQRQGALHGRNIAPASYNIHDRPPCQSNGTPAQSNYS